MLLSLSVVTGNVAVQCSGQIHSVETSLLLQPRHKLAVESDSVRHGLTYHATRCQMAAAVAQCYEHGSRWCTGRLDARQRYIARLTWQQQSGHTQA